MARSFQIAPLFKDHALDSGPILAHRPFGSEQRTGGILSYVNMRRGAVALTGVSVLNGHCPINLLYAAFQE